MQSERKWRVEGGLMGEARRSKTLSREGGSARKRWGRGGVYACEKGVWKWTDGANEDLQYSLNIIKMY